MHPILFRLGPLVFHSYGLMLALGFILAMNLACRRANELGLDASQIQKVAWVSLLAGIAGGRLTYLLLNWQLFASNPGEIFRLDHGGLVFYGGLAAGLLAGLWTVRRVRLPLWKTADLMMPSLALAHAFGRVGCFLNGCCAGKPAAVPWAVAFPGEGIPRHPTQLYEAAFLLFLFFFLNRQSSIANLQSKPPGRLLLTYGLLYGIWRLGIEFLRGDNLAAGGLDVFQWASILLALPCGLLLLRARRRDLKNL